MTGMTMIADDLTNMSRNALRKIADREELGLTKDEIVELTPDELRDEMRKRRVAKGIVAATPDDLAPAWTLTLPALLVRSLGHDAFVTAIAYRDLDKIEVEADVQRPESKKRIPQIAAYVKGDNGFFGATIVTISGANEGHVVFDGERLVVTAKARIVVNDGQHRIAGIRKAIADGLDAERLDDALPVIVYTDLDQASQRQLFADVNLNAVKPPRAIGLNYDDRNALVGTTKALIDSCAVFRGKVNYVKTKLGANDDALFTFATIHDCVDSMKADTPTIEQMCAFWSTIDEAVGPAWDARNYSTNKNAMLALASLYGFELDVEALGSLDWSNLAQIASDAGGTNAAVKALSDELKRRVVKEVEEA